MNFTIAYNRHLACFIASIDGIEIARGSSHLAAEQQAQPLLAIIAQARAELAASLAECAQISQVVQTALRAPTALTTVPLTTLLAARQYLEAQAEGTATIAALRTAALAAVNTAIILIECPIQSPSAVRNHRRSAKRRAC